MAQAAPHLAAGAVSSMGAILNRYIFREIAQTWLAVTGVLLVILLIEQLLVQHHVFFAFVPDN